MNRCPVFFDSETTLARTAEKVPRLVCAGLDAGQGIQFFTHFDAVAWFEWMLRSGRILVGHYVAFDLSVICRHCPWLIGEVFKAYREGRVACTIVRQKLIEQALGRRGKGTRYNLGAVTSRVFGSVAIVEESDDEDDDEDDDVLAVDKNDPWRKRFVELMHLRTIQEYPADAVEYLRRDVAVLRPLYDHQEQFRSSGFLEDEVRQVQHDFALALASAWGVEPNQRAVDELVNAIRGEHGKLTDILYKAGILSVTRKRDLVNGRPLPGAKLKRNMKAIKDYLNTIPGWPRTAPSKKFENGQPKTDATTLDESGDERLQALGKYGELNVVLTKDEPMLRHPVIHTRYDSLKETGRAGSSQPNIMNVKVLKYESKDVQWVQLATGEWLSEVITREHGIRECFQPRQGYIFVSADFGGLELCTWARVCLDLLGRSRMAEILIAGQGPHDNFASQILHIPYEEVVRRKKELEVYQARQTSKVANFGIPGGLGAKSLVAYAKGNYDVILTFQEAKNLIATWHRTYPEGKEYFAFIDRMTRHGGRGMMRQVRSNRIRGNCYYGQMANGFFQGLGADIAKAALFDVSEACYAIPSSPLFGSRVWGFVHDEIILESPIARAPEAGEELSRVMVAAAKPWLEEIPIKAEPALHWIWSKAVETQRDENGRLVPWQPKAK